MGSPRLVVLNDASVARGGATALALLEVELLRRRGVAVTYVAGDAGDNPMFANLDVSVVALGEERLVTAGLRSAGLRGLHNRRTASVVGHWIRRNDTLDTVYHLHGWSQILSPSIFAALAQVRSRVVVTAHDFFLACPNGAFANFVTGATCSLKPLSLQCLATACDKRSHMHKLWRAARHGLQSRLLSFTESRPKVLMIHEAMRAPLQRGGVPSANLSALSNPVTPWSRDRIKVEDNAEVLFVGRLTQEKGADLAARAARRAGVHLSIVGDGPMLDGLRVEFPDVSFAGRLGPQDIAQRARSARALVMPSRYPEPYGLVAVEALWSGIPAILAESALLARDIVQRGAGLSCDPLVEGALAESMSRIVNDNALARNMSVCAFEGTRDLALSPEAWADALWLVFEEVLYGVHPAASAA